MAGRRFQTEVRRREVPISREGSDVQEYEAPPFELRETLGETILDTASSRPWTSTEA